MERLPRIGVDVTLEEKFRILYDWCYNLSQFITAEKSEDCGVEMKEN